MARNPKAQMKAARALGAFTYVLLLGHGILAYFVWEDFLRGAVREPPQSGAYYGFLVLAALVGLGYLNEQGLLASTWWRPLWTVVWALLVVAYLLPQPSLFHFQGPFRGMIFFALASVLVLPLKPTNLRFLTYQVVLVWRSAVLDQWTQWMAWLVAKQWNLLLLPDFLNLFSSGFLLVMVLLMVSYLEFGVDWETVQLAVQRRFI